MRAVLDANIIVAAFPSVGQLHELVTAWERDAYVLVISDHVINEVRIAWSKPYWKERLAPGFVERTIQTLRRFGQFVDPLPGISGIATHEEDDLVIATAVAADADYLVTGDKELLRVGAYRNVRIVSPLEFLEVLRAENDQASDD